MQNFRELTLAELISRQTGAAAIFEKYHLDFCCKGKRTLADACNSQGIDLEEVAEKLDVVFQKQADNSEDFRNMPLDRLADYIVYKHHSYVREMIPILTAHTQKVAEKHGENNTNLVRIAKLWQEVAAELTQHMFKEENILFPYIKRLMNAERQGDEVFMPRQAFISNPIRVMELEHDRAGELLKEIRALSDDYTPPLTACTTYRLSFNELREFEEDLHRHIHLENNLLFPKAIALEGSLLHAVR
jgi:regulator of cell morphogenesis and NO signaling